MPRQVYLPLKELDRCAVCDTNNGKLSLCSRCGECLYCSTQCQKDDWASHKQICGKTERVDFKTFYPFLAVLLEASHHRNDKPPHPALHSVITNAPNPKALPSLLPDDTLAKLLELGERLPSPIDMSGPKWWPQAMSPKVRSKLFRRIVREGYVLTNLLSLCLALLCELYTTTSEIDSASGKKTTRFRLRCDTSPIADFGIAVGKARVTAQDRLAYFHEPSSQWWKGQNPEQHYWLWFKTVSGHEITLECCMFTFNMCLTIPDAPYVPPCLSHLTGNFVPAFFKEHTLDKTLLSVYDERTRLSVLRNKSLQGIAERSAFGEPFGMEDKQVIASFMRKLAPPNSVFDPAEVELVRPWSMFMRTALLECLDQGLYKTFPRFPQQAVEVDPEEDFDNEVIDKFIDDKWVKNMKQLKKQYKRGEATREEINAKYRAWTTENLPKARER